MYDNPTSSLKIFCTINVATVFDSFHIHHPTAWARMTDALAPTVKVYDCGSFPFLWGCGESHDQNKISVVADLIDAQRAVQRLGATCTRDKLGVRAASAAVLVRWHCEGGKMTRPMHFESTFFVRIAKNRDHEIRSVLLPGLKALREAAFS